LDWRGETVMLICGYGDNRLSFKWMIFDKLLAQGLAVLTVDPPGHGEFMNVPTTVATVQHAARAASDWLHARPDVVRVGLLGISFGGVQSAWLMAHDMRIGALVTIASPIKLKTVNRRVVAREALSLLWPKNLALLRYMRVSEVRAEWKTMQGAVLGESLYDMIDALAIEESVRKIGPRPTLFVHGARDQAISPKDAKRMFAVAGPDKEIITVPQATHLSVILYEQPMQRVAVWLREKLSIANAE
jgi:pimeloyl-ACP methyl ester carboxylesterase